MAPGLAWGNAFPRGATGCVFCGVYTLGRSREPGKNPLLHPHTLPSKTALGSQDSSIATVCGHPTEARAVSHCSSAILPSAGLHLLAL